MVDSAVGEAQADSDVGESTESAESQTTDEAQPADAGSDAAPVAETGQTPVDGWKPPTRVEWEATQRHAAVGQQFAPYAREIDALLRERLTGRNDSGASAAPAAPAPAAKLGLDQEEYEAIFGSDKAYEQFLERINTDRKMLPRAVELAAQRAFADRFEKMEKRLADSEGHLVNLRAFNEIIAPRRFAETPNWKQSGKDYLDLLNGGLQDPNKAWEIAEAQARRVGATAAQAAAAGDRAAVKAEAANQKQVAQRRPSPANDKTLAASGRRPTGTKEDTRAFVKEERDGKWERDIVRGALQKLGKL